MASRVWKARFRIVAVVLVNLAMVLATVEVVLRVWPMNTGVQIVRDFGLFEQPGASWNPAVPYWELSRDRINLPCVEQRPEARRVLFLGDSIFYGHALPSEALFSHIAQQRLDDSLAEASPCLSNYAQNGFTGQQMLALAEVLIPALKPAVLFWEAWWSAGNSYTIIGKSAYGLDAVEVGPDGCPNPFGLPSSVNRGLFQRSRLFEFVVLSLARRVEVDADVHWMPTFLERTRRVKELADAHGVQMVLVVATGLESPFDAPSGATRKLESIAGRVAAGIDVPVLFLREALAGNDHQRVRLDACCHLNAEGHQVLADVFDAQIRMRLTR